MYSSSTISCAFINSGVNLPKAKRSCLKIA
nr:MAG TPA: hypothetical protein [Caudoviricetes sp.]